MATLAEIEQAILAADAEGNEEELSVLIPEYERLSLQQKDTGQGYVTSALSSVGRGLSTGITGPIGGAGYLLPDALGGQALVDTAAEMEAGIQEALPVNPIYEDTFGMKAFNVLGQAGSMFATGGAGGIAGKALSKGGTQLAKQAAVRKSAERAALGSGFLSGTQEGGRAAEQYQMEGINAYLRALGGGATEVLTEKFSPFGMAAETGAARRLLGETLQRGKGAAAKDILSEGVEEMAANTGGNVLNKLFAPAEVETPGIFEGSLEAGALGAVGGTLFAGVNAATGAYRTPADAAQEAEFPGTTAPPTSDEESERNFAAGGKPIIGADGVVRYAPPERDTAAGVPVVVEGITIATIPPGSSLSPDDVAAFVGMPDGPAVLKRYADQGRIVLPEIVKPVENVDRALTDEMNQNVAAGAANAPATVEELKKQEAQAQTLARERQAAEEREPVFQQRDDGTMEGVFRTPEERSQWIAANRDKISNTTEVDSGGIFYLRFREKAAGGEARERQKRQAAEKEQEALPIEDVAGVIYDLRSAETGTALDLDELEMALDIVERRLQKGKPIDWPMDRIWLPNISTASVPALRKLLGSGEGIAAMRRRIEELRQQEVEQTAAREAEERRKRYEAMRAEQSVKLDLTPDESGATGAGMKEEIQQTPISREIAEEDRAEFEELQDLMTRRGQAQNKVKGVKFSTKDEARFQELGAKLRGYLFKTVDPETDELLGINDRDEPVYWSDNAKTHYSISKGEVRTGPWVEGLSESALDRLTGLLEQPFRKEPTPAPQPITPLNDPLAPRVFRENSEALNRSQSIPVDREEAVDLIYSKVTQADRRQEDGRFGPDPFDPGSGPSTGFITDNVGEMSQSLRRRAVEGDRILPEEARQLWNEREVIRYAWGQEFNSSNRRTRSNWREGWTALHEPYDAPKSSGPGDLDAFYDVLSADEFLESEGLSKPPPPQPIKPKPAPQPITPTGETPTDSLPADKPTSGDVGTSPTAVTSTPVPKGKVPLYQIRASQGKPVTDADEAPTGWKLNEYTDAIELVSEDATKFAVFPLADSKSYSSKLRALMDAEDWAIDNPVRTQSEAAPMEANYGGGRVEDVQPPKVRFTHTTKTMPGKGQKSGYYPGTYAYEKESGVIPPMEGKQFTGELLESEIYTLTNPDSLKKEASEAGFGYHSGNGNSEVKYLKSKGFKAIRRGSTGGVEIIVFDAADANFQPAVTTANPPAVKETGAQPIADKAKFPEFERKKIDATFERILRRKSTIPLINGMFQVPRKVALKDPSLRPTNRDEQSVRYRTSTKGEVTGNFNAADSRDTIIFDESVRGARAPSNRSPQPTVTTATETPIDAANVDGGSQGVQSEPAEGSIPAVTEDTVSISDIPSTAETSSQQFTSDTIEDALTSAEKSEAATELGHSSWGKEALEDFKARLADWLVTGKTVSKKLAAIFKRLVNSAKALAVAGLSAISVNTGDARVSVESGNAPVQPVAFRAVLNDMPAPKFRFPAGLPQSRPLPQAQQRGVLLPRPRTPRVADFGNVRAPAEVVDTANWVVDNDDTQGRPFVVADKKRGWVYVFNADGSLEGRNPAIFGKDTGDTRKKGTRVTPSGRFEATVDPDAGPLYGTTVDFMETEESVLAIHRVYLPEAKERRRALESKGGADNRMSHGCINVEDTFYDDTLQPLFNESGGVVYILPETKSGAKPSSPRSPAENLVSFTAANGQKLVGEVQSVTGNKATVAYQWNGKTKTQVVPVSQLGSPVASVATPPKYQYNQEQNTRKLGKHFPTALGVHANHDFRKSFASMAKDTALGQDYQMIARMLSKMPEFKDMDLHLVADENIKYAGEYSWNNGKPSIAINLRLIARGQVDALGSILHEALHHVTLAKVRNPQGAFENEVVSNLDLIRESVREYAESKGFGERLDYELGSTEEFITALFTRPDFQALIASIPDSAAPGVAVGKFRSLLSEIFRLIAELVHGKPVLRGSALEQAMTTSLALFNTPFRAIETGGLEALNAARSTRQASPESIRHAELEAKYNAGTITPEETAEAQALVDAAAKAAGYDREAFKAMPEKDWRTDEPINVIKSTNGPWAGFFTGTKEVADRFGRIMRQPVRRTFLKLTKPFEVDASGKAAGELQFDILDDSGTYAQKNNAEILTAISSGKYDAIVLKNTTDEGTVIVPLDPNQIKSADPFTGVPLDQRFDRTSNDTRFSKAEGDAKGKGVKALFPQTGDKAAKLTTSQPVAESLMTPAEWVASGRKQGTQTPTVIAAAKAGNPISFALWDQVLGGTPSDYSRTTLGRAYTRKGDTWVLQNWDQPVAGMTPNEALDYAESKIKETPYGVRSHIGATYSPEASALEEQFRGDNSREAAELFREAKKVLKEKFGNTIPLYRAESTGDADRNVFSYTMYKAVAQKHADIDGRPVIRQEIPVDAVVWYSNEGGEREFLVDRRLVKTGDKATKPINLSAAYQKAATGKSSQWVTIKEVYEQAKADNPSLTPEAFMAQIEQQNEAGGVMISPVENVSTVEAARPFVVGNAGVEMIVPSGTAASRIDDETDAEYLAAVEAGDMEKAQAMVDAAAKRAGFEVEGFHGTDQKFTEFKSDVETRRDSGEKGKGFYFSPKEEFASLHGKHTGRFWVRLANPFAFGVGSKQIQTILDIAGPRPSEGLIKGVAEANTWSQKVRDGLVSLGHDGAVDTSETNPDGIKRFANEFVVFSANQIKSADPVTRDDAGNVIPLSQRFNPESPSILYAAPIDISTLPTREPASGENVPDREAGSRKNAETVSQRLESRREEAISAAVAENDWGNYTREQKVAAAESFLAKWVVSFSAMEFPADVRFSVEAGDGSGAHVSVHEVPSRPLGIRVSVGQNRGFDKYANLSPTEVFAHLYDTAQEESIHVAQYLGMHRDWLAAREQGFKGTFLSYLGQKLKATFAQVNKARIDLQQTDPAAAEKIRDAMLASWNIYHFNDRVEGIAGLWSRLEGDPSRQGDFIMEMVRQLTQLKRQDFTTETGWQKFTRVLKQWLTDAINALRGVQDVFRSGMAGDLIQRQLADLEAALDGKPLPPVSRPAASRADDGEGVIDIGGEAEPADGGGTQLFQKDPTAIGSTFITPADITLQERRSQEETLAKARKIIAEEVQKDKEGGRAIALQRFKTDLSIPPEVRALGSGLVAQQADLLANLELDAFKQEGLDALADQAGKVSGIIGSDYEYWRNLQLAANLDVDKMAEEAARTLNILNVFRRLTPEGFLRRMKRQYNATVQESISQNFDIPPGEVEAEIMRLWRMMREAGATARGEAIAAALKAFMPRRVNTRRIIESLFPQAGTRQRMSKGGEALVRSFFQMMAGPRDQKGPLAEFDESIQNALSGMLRKVMEANGLVAKNQSNQATDIDKLVRSVSADELRFDKIAAADEAMQKELDAIEDPERRSTLQQAWEEATAKMYTNIASDATVRRAINAELKGMNVDWRKMFDSNQKPDAVKAKVVDAVMTKIEGMLTNAADPTVRQNLNMLRGEVEAAFDFIAANKRTEWLAYREGIEARRRVAEHRAAFMEALRNQGVAEDALLRISKKLLAGPLPQKPDRNPVSALVGEHMKEEVPNFVDRLVALDVDRATAEQLDTAAKALRADIAEVERLKAAERAVKKLMDSLKPKPRAPREKIEKALKALFTAAETGALDSQEFFDALGEALGHPPLTAEQQAKIKKLTREINALPKGAARVDKQQELDEELALWKGIAARDVLLSAWYANILSGISTQGIGLFGNLANFLPRSLFLAATNPRSAKAYFQGAFGEGLKTGLREAQAALKGRGLYKVSKYGDKNMVSALELLRKKGPATLPEWIAYIASGGTRLRYVFRIMQAIDALAWNTAREGQAYLAAHRALLDQQRAGVKRSPEEFSRALVENLGGDAKQIEEDMRAARDSLIALGQTPDLLTVDRMAREARNARRSSTKPSNRFADRSVMQQDPEGIGDVISSIITVIQKKGNFMGVPFGQLLIPFNKIVANLFEQSLDYTPVGALRSYLGGHLTDIQSIDWSGKVQFKDKSVQFDAVERAERMAASVTGTLAASVMFALASLFKDEPDEDVPFMIYGFGPESKNKRDQMPKGWTPYSMKVGDAYIKFSEMPFGVMFAAAGNALDAMRYKNMDNKSSAQRLAYVLKTSAKGFTEQGVLSSFDTALEVLTFQASDKKFTDVPVNVAKGMVPGQGMLRDISVLFDPVKIKDDTIAAAFLRDFPVVRRIGTRPALNVFGEPMTFDGRIPFVRRIATLREKHPVADYLGRNGLSIPGMAQTIVVGQYLPKDMKDRIQRRALQTSAMENGVFTVEQDYNFRKRAGELTKAAVEGLLTQVPTITSDRQRENVQNLINRKVEIARRRAMLEAVPAQ